MKRTLILLGCIVALIALVGFIFFEIKDVPDIDSGISYNVEEKDTGGLFVFYKMLQAKYGAANTDLVESDEFEFLENHDDALLITINKNIGLDSSAIRHMKEFVANGNEVLIIGSEFSLKDYSFQSLLYTSARYDTVFQLDWCDGVSYDHEPLVLDGINLFGNLQPLSYFNYNFYSNDNNSASDPMVTHQDLLFFLDTLGIFRKVNLGSNTLHFHSAPELFINSGTASDAYLTNFNKTFENFESKSVIVHKYRRNNINAGANEDSLIKYILSQKSLKYAYYLTILMGIIYVFFSSKRKQKEIPVIEESKNTSLEYINTMSDIFLAQDQNEKLVKHMQRNFFHKVKTAYFLNPDDPSFAEKLSKKSKVPIAKINTIVKQFSLVDSYTYSDDQLIRLYKNVNSFYQTRK